MNSDDERDLKRSIETHFKAVSRYTGWPKLRTDASHRDCDMAVGCNLILELCNAFGLKVEVPE